ncbi:hypothetical protein M378DRAFT_160933 [Amanita muscaria Koide BX008]|uniref:Mid2 domain-containing protein n=1 Tax=Amanita muscaria (strain Koide BX008) TaxID=946122 RepID=A0A0C2SSZ2_AMAMK|nr:hypothetical protein M378DRAFT_160933 [Amanita muscaria Koide BX008]
MYKWTTGRLGVSRNRRAFYGTLLFLFIILVSRAALVNSTGTPAPSSSCGKMLGLGIGCVNPAPSAYIPTPTRATRAIPTPSPSSLSNPGTGSASATFTSTSTKLSSIASTFSSSPSSPSNPGIGSGSASATFTSTTNSSSIASTSSPAPTPQRSPSKESKIGVIVGSTLGGLAVIALVLVFLIRRSRRAPSVRYKKAEGMLDIDIFQRHQPYRKREIPVSVHEPTQSKAARFREARQRELNERIQSGVPGQHELDNLRSLRNAGSAGEIGDPSATGPSRPSPELASLRNEMQQLRDRMDYLQAQRGSDWALGLSDEPLPPAYTQLSNNVQ